MLGIGEYMMTFPCPGDALDNYAHPELAEDLKEDEGAESIQRDLRRGVFGFREGCLGGPIIRRGSGGRMPGSGQATH